MMMRFQGMYESSPTHIERKSSLRKTKTGMKTPNSCYSTSNIIEIPRVIMKKRLPYQETPSLHSEEMVQQS